MTVLQNLSSKIPIEELMKMRRLQELEPYLPLEVAGLTVKWNGNERAKTRAGRQGGFLTVSNTPALQELMTGGSDNLGYDPREIATYLKKNYPSGYDAELEAWEGEPDKAVMEFRDFKNPFHLLEQALIMGPEGGPEKRGPAPIPWDIFDKATDELITVLRRDIGRETINPKFLAPCTPASTKRGLRLSHILENSAGEPFFSDPGVQTTRKRAHLRRAVELASGFYRDTNSLPMWPAVAFARSDRVAAYEYMLDTEEARGKGVRDVKGRLIAGQSFVLQLLDGVFTQALSEAIADSKHPEIDIREPWLLSDHLVDGLGVAQSSPRTMTIGSDESGWDHHFTPQMWYGVFRVYRALFPETVRIPVVYTDYPLVLSEGDEDRIASLDIGTRVTLELTVLQGEDETVLPCEVETFEIDTESALRRVFAGCSGTGIAFGPIEVSGYGYTLDTPRDGRFRCGWSMRSGNWMTFLANSLANEIKLSAIGAMSRDPASRAAYQQEFGVEPPRMDLRWLVVRGDDAGQVWEYESGDAPISEVMANWLSMTGALANAKKQETSDEFGRFYLGFAQLFVNETYPRGVSSGPRTIARMLHAERDEVVLDDPNTGEDLRPVLRLMNMVGRISNIWGLWNRGEHPAAGWITDFIQDIDVRDRLLPPLTEEERERAARAFALKLLRRGQLTSLSQMDETVRAFWDTPLAQHTQRRYDSTGRLTTDWSPLPRRPDARSKWR